MMAKKKKKFPATQTANAQNNSMTQFDEHPYIRMLIEKSLIPVMRAKKEAEQTGEEFVLTPSRQYHIDVFYRSASLYDAVKRLYDIPYFMLNNPSFRSMEKHNVTPEDWFVYHYANFRVIAIGIYDTALIVTNFVLGIDLPSRDCTDAKIRKHALVAEKGLDAPISDLKSIVEKYREERNFYAHRSERPELDFVDQLKGYRFLKEAKARGLYKGELPKQTIANALFVQNQKTKRSEMRLESDEISSAVLKLCDAWYPIYTNAIEAFSSDN